MKHNFLQLDFWKKSRVLVKEIYLLTKDFPSEEKFGLISQIHRAAVSIPSNISEGYGGGRTLNFHIFSTLPSALPVSSKLNCISLMI